MNCALRRWDCAARRSPWSSQTAPRWRLRKPAKCRSGGCLRSRLQVASALSSRGRTAAAWWIKSRVRVLAHEADLMEFEVRGHGAAADRMEAVRAMATAAAPSPLSRAISARAWKAFSRVGDEDRMCGSSRNSSRQCPRRLWDRRRPERVGRAGRGNARPFPSRL